MTIESPRLHLLAAALLVAVTPGFAGAEPDHRPPARVAIRLYDANVLSAAMRARSLETAGAALASAALEVVWRDCRPAAAHPACASPLAGDYAVRIVRAPAASRPGPLALGNTMVDLGTRSAALATVYADRVEAVAAAVGVDPGSLLGYAVAHEVGHLLLASARHSEAGLMRSIWNVEEIRREASADWTFAAADAAAIAERLTGAPRAPSTAVAAR